jgi:hypothetical protein
LERIQSTDADYRRLNREVQAQYPELKKVSIARQLRSDEATGDSVDAKESVLLAIDSARPLGKLEIQRLESWLAVRLPQTQVTLLNVPSARGKTGSDQRQP